MKDEIEKNIKFINDSNILDDDYLWKYIDIHKFLFLIINRSLYLTRLDKFEDKREGISPIHLLYKNKKKEFDKHEMFDSIREFMTVDTMANEMNKIEDALKNIQRFNFASCWVIGKKQTESVAMWNLYSDPKSIAIRIKYSDFKNNLLENGYRTDGVEKELICSSVNYIDFQDSSKISELKFNLTDSVFLKDISFKHENEFRIVAKETPRKIPHIQYKTYISNCHIENLHNSNHNYSGINVELENFENYNFEIVHHPKSTDWTKKNINKIVEQFNMNFKIFDSNLELN